MLLSKLSVENPFADHTPEEVDNDHSNSKFTVDLDHHQRDASVQSWQCFPEGSLSSIDSLPPIEDDESIQNNDSPARVHLSEEPSSRVKLMCSYGGRIIPRPLDGKLRYVGGETRIISVLRDITYSDLIQKMMQHYGLQELSLKYQLPNEELDALISVSTDEDLQNMMEEYDRLEGGGDGLQRLRVFLCSAMDGEVGIDGLDPKKSEQWYVEAVNGLLETSSRRSDSNYSGYSGSGLSARPSYDNLLGLDNIQGFEDPATALHVKRIQDVHHAPPQVVQPHVNQYGNEHLAPPQVLQPHVNQYGNEHLAPPQVLQPHVNQYGNTYLVDGQVVGGMLSSHDNEYYYSAPVHEHGRGEPKMPRVNSHGKLSRLQDDGSAEVHEQVENARYVAFHCQHPIENQDYMREYNGLGGLGGEAVYSHVVSQQHPHVPPQAQVIYHKDNREYHHRHILSDDALPLQHQPHQHHHQEEYYASHLYQRTTSHPDVCPSSPRPAFRHTGPSTSPFHVHMGPSGYGGNTVEAFRRPLMREDNRMYRPSTSPPGYREHADRHVQHVQHPDEHRNLFYHAGEHDPPGVPGVYVVPGYPDSSFYNGGEARRPMPHHVSPQLAPLDYQAQMEHLSLHPTHPQRQRVHGDHVHLTTGYTRVPQVDANHYGEQRACVPLINVQHNRIPSGGGGSGGKESEVEWLMNDDVTGLCYSNEKVLETGSGSVSTRMNAMVSSISSSNSAGLDCGQRIHHAPLLDLPIFDKSGIYEPPSPTTTWNVGSNVHAVDITSQPPVDLLTDAPTSIPVLPIGQRIMSETGQLAEDVASSVLKSSTLKHQTQTVGEPQLISEPTFTAQNWEKALIGGDATAKQEENACKEEGGMRHEQENCDLDEDKETEDIRFTSASAEQEAITRGLQTIKNCDLEEIRELGSGTYGTVYHGKWRGTDVAIKRIKASCFEGKPSERERLLADFWKEACILSKLHHPNVVAFYGVVPDGPGGTLATVTEYMINGSLKQVLQKKDRTIDRRKRLLIATDAAFGMEYLHGKNIVHFDLKCENLLVNMRDPHRPVCKVGDLGLSKVKRQTMVSGGVRGTLPWMAPELLSATGCMVTEKVDVYSFAIVMWELLTGEEPYADMHYGAIIGGIVSNTLRPPIPSWCDPAWRSLMERCWSADASNRPSFSEVASELRAMFMSLQPK